MNKKKILKKLQKKGLIFDEDYNSLLKEIEENQEKVLSDIKKGISGYLLCNR